MPIRPYPVHTKKSDTVIGPDQFGRSEVQEHVPKDEVAAILLDPAFPYGEHLLQFLWEQRLFNAQELHTTNGQTVEVLAPGRIQTNSGPDLVDARLRLNGQEWAGTVEVHIRASEWERHGHQHDPAYNNVILHVVHTHDANVCTVNGTVPPTVALEGRIDKKRVLMFQELMRNKGHVPCSNYLGNVDAMRIGLWLDRVLLERLERKNSEVGELHASLEQDPSSTFYHMLLRGFGFKVNAEPFGMLAHSLPLKVLLKYRDDPFRTAALLFGQAGFLQTDHIDDYPRTLQTEYAVLAQLHNLRPMPLAAWKFGRMRPSNFPTIRIAQLAALFSRIDGHFGALLEHDSPAPILDMLNVEANDYWNTHHRFDAESKPEIKRLGAASGERLIANVIVPYLFAMKTAQGKPALSERALQLLEDLPPERNVITDQWAKLGVQNPSAARSQGLIELKNSYCGQRKCLSCVIGAQVLKNT